MCELLSMRIERRKTLYTQLAELQAAKNIRGVPSSLHDSTIAEVKVDIAVYDLAIAAMEAAQISFPRNLIEIKSFPEP